MNYYEDRGSKMAPSDKKEAVIWINNGKVNKEIKVSEIMNHIGWVIGFNTFLGLVDDVVKPLEKLSSQEISHHWV